MNRQVFLLIFCILLLGCTQKNGSVSNNNKIRCGVDNPCPNDMGCYSFEDEDHPICWAGSPCDKCSSGECIIGESYPMQVFCQ